MQLGKSRRTCATLLPSLPGNHRVKFELLLLRRAKSGRTLLATVASKRALLSSSSQLFRSRAELGADVSNSDIEEDAEVSQGDSHQESLESRYSEEDDNRTSPSQRPSQA
jgi:hypothetical protein